MTSATAPHRDWRLVAIVALGGAVGSVLRYSIAPVIPTPEHGWPWATFAANLVGAFALGWLLEALAARGPEGARVRRVRLFAGTGVLGGFTTYSSFVLELDRLVVADQLTVAAAYAAGTLALGLAAALAGVVVGQRTPPGTAGRLLRKQAR